MPLDRTALADSLKLRAGLRSLSDATISAIADHWGFSRSDEMQAATTVQDKADFLYPRLQAPQYFRPTFDKLSSQEKDLLYFLALHGGEMGFAELATRSYRGKKENARNVVVTLENKGFLFTSVSVPVGIPTEDTWLSVPETYLKLLTLPAHLQGFLGGLLREQTPEALQAIAARVLGEEPAASTDAAALRARIRHTLTDPNQLRAYIEQLPDLESQILQDVIDHKGFCLYRDLLDTTSPKKFDHTRAENLNSLINTSGLVYTANEGHNKYLNSLVVPRDLLYIITRNFQPDTRSLQKIDTQATGAKDFTPSTIIDNSQALLRDMSIFAGRIDILRAKKLAGGGISRTDLKKAVSVFPASKPVKYAVFLANYLIETDLLVEVNDEWRCSEEFLRQISNPDALYKSLWRWVLRTVQWNELYAEGSIGASEKAQQDFFNVRELRHALLKEISSVARDRWMGFEAFWEVVAPRLEAQFLKAAGTPGTTTPIVLKETSAAILGETFVWLGILFYGGSADRASAASGTHARARTDARKTPSTRRSSDSKSMLQFSFQLTPFGKSFLHDGALDSLQALEHLTPPTGYLAHGARWLIIQPNLEIVAPPDLALDAIFHLARFTDIKNMDVMTTLELTRDSLRACLERGTGSDDLLNFLAQLSRSELPQTVRHMVEEYSTRHGEVRLGTSGGYIAASDEAVLESIRRHPKLAGVIKDQLSDEVLILAEQTDVPKVARELRTLGFMPQVETGTVHSTSDGRYHLSLSAQELHDLIASTRFVKFVEQSLDTDMSDGQAAVLAQRLSPEQAGFFGAEQGAESRSRIYQKRFETALQKLRDDIEDKYKNQVSRLVTKSISGRGPSKYHFKGVNPAVERDDVVELINFAIDYDLDVELLYVKQNEQETRVVLSPKTLEGERLYAHNPSTDADGIYSVPRILRAKLL